MKICMFPGQGSQKKGMGEQLFVKYDELVQEANEILGYDLAVLCGKDPDRLLNNTRYTQPALFVVSALTYLDSVEKEGEPDYVLGHSLGEYAALFAAGAFSFGAGVKLVKQRGEMMNEVKNGGMAALIGLKKEAVEKILQHHNLGTIDIANYNTPEQIIVAGPREDIMAAQRVFESNGAKLYFPLNVSGAFHSRYMQEVAAAFGEMIARHTFTALRIPVIANVNALPYTNDNIGALLTAQITQPVKWWESIHYVYQHTKETPVFFETGPGDVLKKMLDFIPALAPAPAPAAVAATGKVVEQPQTATGFSDKIMPEWIGSADYKKDYKVKYAYAAGAMVHGIASKEMVVKMGRAGMMSYFGTGGMKAPEVEKAIVYIQQELQAGEPYGMNMLNGAREEEMVALMLKYNIRNIEASAYIEPGPALVKLRLKGLHRKADGSIESPRRIMAKISRPEVAELFLSPPSERIVAKLLADQVITAEEAALGKNIPMADDLCVEADSGGHTDQGVAWVLVPTIIRQRDASMKKFNYAKRINVGTAGGIGTPEAAAAAFVLGADFILTGSINQCTVEAGVSEVVKDMLQQINIQDTTYAPAGDMFEIGAKIQVLKKGVFFPARANKLYDLYKQYNTIHELSEETSVQLQQKYFKRSFDEIYEEVKAYYPPAEIALAERNPKQKMAYIFRWYFGHTTRLALNGDSNNKVDFQVHCGPALGAFNQWVKGTALEDWRNRHVDEIALKMMTETAVILHDRMQSFYTTGGKR
ncbi:ACP S-malonyltransferase [Chitinophaga nivalis]|uniref:[acyl-carrier-protein] S-malonyltransferase n=1 Tax=Chitinophaga nivalis TaxID=2991709 RepID=A0ABT3IMW7_9BACT|nr:ACP S-malonyltransferase [Chitinophaga nivalis]MCW3464997.1 ACP S-malonyltransferase [Chitinophaga nivalis]MCW3485311.1 ACP S-malonyltransferase [Chitinophaga nivalis]